MSPGINLWDEHIPDRTLVVLGGQDILSPAFHLNTWLREHTHAQVSFSEVMCHVGHWSRPIYTVHGATKIWLL